MVLPITKHRTLIEHTVITNQVTVIVGETGSGKTTETPKILFEAGFAKNGIIGITEPRRIAAISVADYVARTLNVNVDNVVAYKVRFEDITRAETALKFMTDGILLREFHVDPMLSKYSVIMIDEAHERSANIDFLLGLLKQLLPKRPDLRLVIASATIDAQKFSRYFGGAPIITVEGRLHDVKIVWGTHDLQDWKERVEAVTSAVSEILNASRDGDILVFLPGIDEINAVAREMESFQGSHSLVVLPAHGSLSPEEQRKVFDTYPGQRKVVLATNVAETSITIDGIVYVVDTGCIKQMNYDASIGMQSLDVVDHSQAGCGQRSGRAGRTRPGVCYRLYTEENYSTRPRFTEPEIRRMSLASVVLAMEALEIPNIKHFDFIDPPDAEAFHEAYETLEALGAIEDDKPGLTPIGKEMAALPLEPRVSRMVIEARKLNCVKEVVTIAAFLSAGRTVFARPQDKEREASVAHMRFKNPQSDMLTCLTVWNRAESFNFSSSWCHDNYLSFKTLKEIRYIRSQLFEQLRRSNVVITDARNDEAVLRSVAAGLAYNLLRYASRHSYDGVERPLQNVFIHPGSSLFGGFSPEWMVAAEVVQTRKRFARMCSVVQAAWLPEIAPSRFSLGECEIRGYMPGDETVEAVRPILYKKEDGTVTQVGMTKIEKISLEDASAIQKTKVREAKRAGWVLLTIEETRDVLRFPKLVGRGANGPVYQLLSGDKSRFPLGSRFFCRLYDSISVGNYVEPQFRVFDFPGAEPAARVAVKAQPKENPFAKVSQREGNGSLGDILEAAIRRQANGA